MTGFAVLWRWLRRDPVLLPLLCLFDLFVASTAIIHDTGAGPARRQAQIAAAVLGFALLTWRHRAPVAAFAAQYAHAVAVWFLLHEYRPTAGLVVALYAVAVTCRRSVSLAALAAAVLRSCLSGIDSVRVESYPRARVGEFLVTVLMFAVIYGVTWALGTIIRGHRIRVQDLEAARRRARAEAVTAERRRLAGELHDLVSHSVTLMVLQAAGASRLAAADPVQAQVQQALAHIQSAGQQAMAELRELLDALRAEATEPERASASPLRLSDVDVVLDTLRRAGLHIDLRRGGIPRPLAPEVELAALRVIQESLSNTLKHAGIGAHVLVRLRWDDALVIRVDNEAATGTGSAGLSAGHGLRLLAERVRAVGGALTAAPRPEGGFQVSARLPVLGQPAYAHDQT